MKTTVEIDDEILRAAKRAAIDRRCTLRQLVERGLQHELQSGGVAARPISWVAATGQWPQDLDLSNREAMYNWMEAER